MALANEMVLDLTEALKKAEQMDKHLASWVDLSNQTTINLKKGLQDAISSLQSQLNNINGNGIGNIGGQATKSIDDVNELLASLRQLSEAYSQLKEHKGSVIDLGDTTKRIKELEERISSINLMLKEGKNEKGRSLTPKQQQALVDERAVLAQQLRIQQQSIEQKIALEEKALNKVTNSLKRHFKERANEEIKAKENAQKEYAKRAKQYQEQNKKKNQTYSGALAFSSSAKTLNREIQAVKNLEAARNALSKTDANYKRKLNELNKRIREHNASINRAREGANQLGNSHRNLMNISEKLTRRLALVFSVSQITGYVKKLASVRGEFELQQKSLAAIIQNKEAANEIWDKTVQLAVKSPFQLKELVTYTKQMAAYRVETEKLHDTTKMLADVSAGLGVDMQRLILAYGQVKAANYLRGTELRQFSEAGINILGELSEYFTEVENRAVSVGEVFEMVSKRMVSFADVEEIFKRITSEGGIFYNMQELQAQTIKGMTSNLRDSLDIMLNDIGASNEDLIKGSLRLARQLLESWEEWSNWVFPTLAAFLARWALVGVVSRKNFVAIEMVFDAFSKQGWNRFGAAFTRFNVYATAIAAFVAIVWSAVKAIRAMNKETKELNNIELEGAFDAGKMASRYKELAGIVQDTTKSYDEQKKALDTLKREYSDILPAHLLEAKTIRGLKNDYTQATNAINEYISAKTKEKQISYIEKKYGSKVNKQKDRLISNIYKSMKGDIPSLTRSDIVPVVNGLVAQMEEGILSVADLSNELKRNLEIRFGKEVNPMATWFVEGVGVSENVLYSLYEAVDIMQSKIETISNKEFLWGDTLPLQLEEIKKTYEAQSKLISDNVQIIRDFGNGLVTEDQKNKALETLNSLFKDAEKEAPKWNEIINDPFRLNDATIKANEIIWGNLIKKIEETEVSSLQESAKEKYIETLKKELEAFKGNDFEQEVRRVALLIAKKMGVSLEGLRSIMPSKEIGRNEYAKTLKEQIEFLEESIAQNKIDKQKAARFGLEDATIERMKKQLPFLKEFYTYFYHKEDSTGANKIFEERLRILREMYDAYKDMRQHNFGEDESTLGVIEKYQKAFRDAYNFDYSEWGNFFTSEEGFKGALKKLEQMTSDIKDKLKIDLVLGDITWDKKKAEQALKDKQLKDDVEKMFSDYESWLDIDKLSVSTEFAKALFNIESMDLETLKSELQKRQHEFLSLDMLDEYNNYLKKIKELETKAQQERMEGYLEYTRTTISQRAQLELKAMRDLANARKDIQDKEVLSQVESGIQKKLSQDLDKLNWEAFKSSDVFVKIFNDLDNVSQDALKSMIEQLNDYKDEWKNLPIQEMKEVATQLERMEKALAMKKAGDNPFSFKSIRSFAEQAKSREEVSNAQKDILEADKLLLKYKSQEESLQTINQLVNKKKNATQAIVEYNAKYGTNLETQWADQQDILNMTKEQTDNLQKLAKKETERKENAQGIVDATEAYLFALQMQHQYLGDILQMANDLYGAFENVLAVCDEWGAELDESVAIFAQAGMDMTNTVIQTIQLQIQLNAAAQEATSLGIAMNAAMSIIGWIVMAVQLLTTALSAIAKAHDNSLQKQIEHDAEAVELLQKRYEKLEKAIDNAMSFGKYQKAFDENKRNLEEQIRLTEDMIALEEDKKKTDKDAIKGYKDEIEDYNEQLQEMEEKRISDMGGFGSEEAIKDAAEGFIDAWLSAYKETGDGLSALKEQWNEYFDNLVKKQMVMKMASKYIEGALKEIDDALMFDNVISPEEMAHLKQVAEDTSVNLNNILKQFAEQIGYDGGLGGGNLEGLSESIQGVTEVTAQALEAILNSMRFYVIDNNTQQKRIVEIMESWEVSNPMLSELRNQTNYLSDIYGLLNDVVRGTKSFSVS